MSCCQKFQLMLMLIHSLLVCLETMLHCSVQSVYMQNFQKFLLIMIVLYLCWWLVFQHIMLFCQLALNILIHFLSFLLVPHVKLLAMISIDSQCLQCIMAESNIYQLQKIVIHWCNCHAIFIAFNVITINNSDSVVWNNILNCILE